MKTFLWFAFGVITGGVGRPIAVHATYLSIIAALLWKIYA